MSGKGGTAASCNFVEKNTIARSEPGFLLGQHFRKKEKRFFRVEEHSGTFLCWFLFLCIYWNLRSFTFSYAKSFIFIVTAVIFDQGSNWEVVFPHVPYLSLSAQTSRWENVCSSNTIWLLAGPSFGRHCRFSPEFSQRLQICLCLSNVLPVFYSPYPLAVTT